MSDNKQEDIEKLQTELAEFKQKSEDYLNSWKRTAADFENYKKRQEREAKELIEFAREVTVVKILPLLESLEGALKQVPDDEKIKKWSEGVVKIVLQLEKTLIEMGIEKIKTVGEKFDHSLHEAVEMVSGSPSTRSGTIIEEVQSGYKINKKIIRPAKVKVSK